MNLVIRERKSMFMDKEVIQAVNLVYVGDTEFIDWIMRERDS